MKKKTCIKKLTAILMSTLVICGCMGKAAYAQTYNYWTSKESFQIYYDGYIQFTPYYKTTKDSGYGLEANRYVKQAYINYSRNNESVIGGRKYTSVATAGWNKVSVSASCWDSLLWGEKYNTKFNYGWIYDYK